MNNTIWHIVKVAPSRTLKLHSLFSDNGFDVWTPYKVKHQKLSRLDKRNGISRRSFCLPIFGQLGFMFVGLPALGYARHALTLRTIIDKSRHIHDAILSPIQGDLGPQWYTMPEKAMTALRNDHAQKNGQDNNYDPLKDNKKGAGKGYAADIVIPEFTENEIARFISGSMRGIDFEVTGTFMDKVFMDAVGGGWLVNVVADAVDLEKKEAA